MFQPIAQIAPFLIDKSLLGTIISGSTTIFTPKPVQSGQAPFGLLKEKLGGSISPILMPQSGQAKFWLNTISSLPTTSTIIIPPVKAETVSTASLIRLFAPSFITILSTTISILCFLFLSSSIFSLIS